jgi:hypothetical protein
MDPLTAHEIPPDWQNNVVAGGEELPGTRGINTAQRPEAFVLFERGNIEKRIVHDEARVEQRKQERELEALAGRYSAYVQTTDSPITFEQFVQIAKQFAE